MAELKTRQNEGDVHAFLNREEDEQRRKDCFAILDLMQQVTGEPAKMWGDSIIGFGAYHYRYASGHEGDAPLAGFSPRKQHLALYILAGFAAYDDLLARLGKYKTGKACLYIKRLADVDPGVLRELVARSVAHMRSTYP